MRKPKFPDTLPADVLARVSAADAAPPPPVDFTPVPRLRARRNGWTEDRQRGFIAALARCGSVSAASREVGISARSAYRLLDAPGAGSFAKAWDIAADCGRARLTVGSLDRALHGDYVPVYRRGKLVRVELRRNDRMAIAMLNGADKPVDDYRRISVSRRRQSRQEWKQFDLDCAARAAEEEARAAAEEARAAESVAAYQAEVDAYIASCRARRLDHGPRIRML